MSIIMSLNFIFNEAFTSLKIYITMKFIDFK